MRSFRVETLTAACLALIPLLAAAQDPAKKKEEKIPDKVSYYKDVRPIFQQHCQGCHQPAKAQGGYVMTDYADLLKKTDHDEPGILAGQPDKSIVVSQITPHNGKPPQMPRGKDPLSEREVKLIRSWIAQGAADDTPASARAITVNAEHPPVYELPPVIDGIAFSPDGSLLAVTGYHEVLLYKADGSQLVARLVGVSERLQSVDFSPNGKWLAATGGNPGRFGELQIWDVAKKKLKLSVPVTFDTIYGARWSPDSKLVSLGGADNSLRAIDAESGKQVLFQGGHNDWVLDTVFSLKGTHLISVSRDRSMKLTEVATERLEDNITSITPGALKGGLQAVDRHPHRDELLCGGADGVPKVYQMFRTKARVIGDDFNLIKAYPGLAGRIFAMRYSPDGSHFVVGASNDGKGEARVFATGEELPRLYAQSVALVPTLAGSRLPAVATLFERALRAANMAPVTLEGIKGPIYTVAYHPRANVVACAGFDGVVYLHNADDGKLLREFVAVPLTTRTAAK